MCVYRGFFSKEARVAYDRRLSEVLACRAVTSMPAALSVAVLTLMLVGTCKYKVTHEINS